MKNKLFVRILFHNAIEKYQNFQLAVSITKLATGLSDVELTEVLNGPL